MRLVPSSEEPRGLVPGDDEAELVRRARDGVGKARSELFRRHAPVLLPMLVRLLGSTADADDALQDAFVEAFRDLGSLRDDRAFGGWLRRIAVHRAHRAFRRRRLLGLLGLDGGPGRGLGDASLDALAAPSASPELRAELALLATQLSRLPAPERIAWSLRHVEGYDLEEVASACDCSLATAKRRIAGAHARLARHLALPENADG